MLSRNSPGWGRRMRFGQLKRREFITLLGGAAAALPLAARAQQAGKVWRIGMLDTTGEAAKSADISAFRRGLAGLDIPRKRTSSSTIARPTAAPSAFRHS